MRTLLPSLLLFSQAPSLFAQGSCTQVSAVVYFGNGVGSGVTTIKSAMASLGDLKSDVKGSLSSDEQRKYSFKLAFNHSGGKLADVIETARQTLGNEWPTLLVALILRDARLLSLVPDEAKNGFNDFLTNRTIQEMVAPGASNSDVDTQVQSYESDIGEGKKVIVVAHSQGNVFANLAFQRLDANSARYFAIVPVASPESFVRKNLVGHVRFADDLVIGGVELAKAAIGLAVPLAVNDEDDVDADFLSHGFSEAYLADPSSNRFIVQGVISTVAGLQNPPGGAGQGIITVTLTWGANPDVDLHIYEPTGGHVFYSARTGAFGYLDVDDVTGFGPEHYFASCESFLTDSLAVGRYRFGVNYYSGSSPETAVVTVKTPTSEITRSVVLSAARGSSGDNSMVPVADVVVSRSAATGAFDFSIQ
ncbi:MAG TPA: hypothetical protein VJ385_00800 [Fibrobacteria bacterium]|nr:hypothetical protein [Fibrobacteria bacterium]